MAPGRLSWLAVAGLAAAAGAVSMSMSAPEREAGQAVRSEVRRPSSARIAVRRPTSGIQRLRLTVTSQSGDVRIRELERRFRRDGEATRTWIGLSAPADVAGTQLLLVDHPGQTDELMLYLPAYRRVNRVSGSSRRGHFAGSDLAYEDLELLEGGTDAFALVEEHPDAWVVDVPADPDSTYTKVRTIHRRSDLVPERIELYDADGLLKTIEVVRTVRDGGHVLPEEVEIRHRRGSRTRVEVLSTELDVSRDVLPDETFTQAFLEREVSRR